MLCGMARSPTLPIVQCVHCRPHPLPLRGVSERNGSQDGTASLAQSDRVNVFGRLMAQSLRVNTIEKAGASFERMEPTSGDYVLPLKAPRGPLVYMTRVDSSPS